MKIGQGAFTYEWVENWARIPESYSGHQNGRTHGVVVSETGKVLIFNQAQPGVVVFDPEGRLLNAWGDRFLGAHGMTLVKEGKVEYLWLTDQRSGEVVKTTLDGRTVQNILPPEIAIYKHGGFVPTWVAVNEERHGGNGDIWVTDGYGKNLVHRYDKAGRYLNSISGEEGAAGAFKCPHGIWVDTRKAEPELYIADRGNKRIQVYSVTGTFKRCFGSDILTSPCGFVTLGDNLYIPELRARLAILDKQDKLVCYLGDNEKVCDIPGWPNHKPELIEAGKFNSPHGMAVDPAGNIYVAEWIVGGRLTKLIKK